MPKVTSATKLIRLAQTYSEEQGRDQSTINDALEDRLTILEQQVDAACAASNGGFGGVDRRSPVSPASPGLCGINTAGLSEWMTGVDKQLQDLHELIFAGISPGGSSGGDHRVSTESIQQQAAAVEVAEAAGKDTVTAALEAQQAVQDEYARMEERVSRLEATLAETVKMAAPSRILTAEGPTGAAELSRGRSRSLIPAPTPPPSPPPPPPQEAIPAAGEVGNDMKLLNAVQEGATFARRASELAQEALQAGKAAVDRSERTGKPLNPMGSGGKLLYLAVCPGCVCVRRL